MRYKVHIEDSQQQRSETRLWVFWCVQSAVVNIDLLWQFFAQSRIKVAQMLLHLVKRQQK